MPSTRTITLAVVGVTLALSYGIWYSYSVILVALLQEFGWSRSVLAGAFSLFTLLHGGINPLVGAMCDRVRPLRIMAWGGAALGAALVLDSFIASPWQLYVAFGALTAVAVAAAGWIPALVQVQRDFHDKLGLALGIVSAGVGVGMLLVVPLTQLLIDAWGWRVAFRVLAAICVLWIVPSSLFMLRYRERHPRQQQGSGLALMQKTASTQDQTPSAQAPRRVPPPTVTVREALRTMPFWLMVAGFFFGNICSQTLHVHHVAYLVDQGLSALLAASVVGVVGAASIGGKIGGGWLSDRMEREKVYVAGIAVMLAAVAALAALGAGSPAWAIYGYAVLFGVGYSATASLIPAMMSDRFGGRHFGAIMGLCLIGSSFGSAAGPLLGGVLFDATGTYMGAFAIAGLCGVIAGAAGWHSRTLRLRSVT